MATRRTVVPTSMGPPVGCAPDPVRYPARPVEAKSMREAGHRQGAASGGAATGTVPGASGILLGPIRLPKGLSMGDFTTLMARDGHEFQAYLAAPPGRPRGAVVVIQEIFGINRHIRAVTDGFASEGYTAIAPALFDRIRRGIELGYDGSDMDEGRGYMQQLKPEQTLKDVAAAIAVVRH